MALFKKTDEQKAERQRKVDEAHKKQEDRLAKYQDKNEKKARERAAKSNFNVVEAIYVFGCLPNDDEKGALNMPLGAIFADRVVKFQKRWTGDVIEETPIKNVTSVEISKGLTPTVTIYASGNNISFKVGVEAPKIATTIRELISSGSSGASVIDPVVQVEKLAQLLEKGLLTKEEFEKKKRELLGL